MSGVRLESYYVNQLCSPTRTSLLSGRYAYTIGMNGEVITDGNPSVMPLNMDTVADHLSRGGWATWAGGKWDAGMTCWGATPTCRGFDHFSGFYNAFNDYFTHRVGVGLDLRNDTQPDFANRNESGVYMTELITSRVSTWIRSVQASSPSRPTFAYVAHEAVHAPNQVPASYLEGPCNANIPAAQPIRKILCGMLRAVDMSVKNITDVYRELGILDDTLIIFSTDNGGNTETGGFNGILRGNKATTFEGGVRGLGFVSGAGLQAGVQGSVSQQLIHVSDWLPTLVQGIAGLPLTDSHAHDDPPPPPLDGVDQWAAISTGAPSARSEVLLNLLTGCHPGVPCRVAGQYALRQDQWKLIYGHTSVFATTTVHKAGGDECVARTGIAQPNTIPLPVTAATSPPFCPAGWVPPPESGLQPLPPPDVNCSSLPCNLSNSAYMEGGVFLFDVVADPGEHNNLAAEHPDIVAKLLARLRFYNASQIPQENGADDPRSNPNRFGGVWTPWRGDPDPAKCSTNMTVPGEHLRSNFDGVRCTGKATCTLQGWLWDPDMGGGREALTVQISLDNQILATQVADIPRAGLPSKTGAPNTEHGFQYTLTAQQAAAFATGRHRATVSAVYPHGALVDINRSPQCYSNEKEVPC